MSIYACFAIAFTGTIAFLITIITAAVHSRRPLDRSRNNRSPHHTSRTP